MPTQLSTVSRSIRIVQHQPSELELLKEKVYDLNVKFLDIESKVMIMLEDYKNSQDFLMSCRVRETRFRE